MKTLFASLALAFAFFVAPGDPLRLSTSAHAEEPADPHRFGMRPWFQPPMFKERRVKRGERARIDRGSIGRSRGMITVPTAAGISITVAAHSAPKFQGFISGMVARGYKPRAINCYATGGHVSGSLHYRGEACDIDQRGWNKTAGPMYRASGLAQQNGLRDGCSFGDCGHIDTGARLGSRKGQSQMAGHWPIPFSGLQDIPR